MVWGMVWGVEDGVGCVEGVWGVCGGCGGLWEKGGIEERVQFFRQERIYFVSQSDGCDDVPTRESRSRSSRVSVTLSGTSSSTSWPSTPLTSPLWPRFRPLIPLQMKYEAQTSLNSEIPTFDDSTSDHRMTRHCHGIKLFLFEAPSWRQAYQVYEDGDVDNEWMREWWVERMSWRE